MRVLQRWIGVIAFASGLCATASAAELNVRVSDNHGHPLADAVVTLVPQNAAHSPAPKLPSAPRTKIIDQKDEMFVPYIEIFRPGDKVLFRNSDQTRHDVYSFSPTKSFEFVLVPGESSKPLELDQNGVVAVGCNIHDQMITYLFVSDAAWIERSGVDGRVRLRDVPAGAWNVRVWHPDQRPGTANVVQATAIMNATESKTLTIAMATSQDSQHVVDRPHARASSL
ncbi:MAG TPA: methylamine utilization protein [Xanthomonadaceae bacterium]|nr:methylamine utilization protein [Xanthomonadaceae bacterium]